MLLTRDIIKLALINISLLQDLEVFDILAGLLTPTHGNVSEQCKEDGLAYVNKMNKVKQIMQ